MAIQMICSGFVNQLAGRQADNITHSNHECSCTGADLLLMRICGHKVPFVHCPLLLLRLMRMMISSGCTIIHITNNSSYVVHAFTSCLLNGYIIIGQWACAYYIKFTADSWYVRIGNGNLLNPDLKLIFIIILLTAMNTISVAKGWRRRKYTGNTQKHMWPINRFLFTG